MEQEEKSADNQSTSSTPTHSSPQEDDDSSSGSDEQKHKKDSEEGLPPGEHIGPHNGEKGQDDVTENQHVVSSEEEVIEMMKKHQFSIDELIEKIAFYHVHSSTRKKANEVYSWGSGHQVEGDSGWKKREVAGVGIAGAVAGGLIAIGAPLAPVGVGIAPLAAGLGILGMTISKAKPGGLIPIVAGCLQQRVALTLHDICVDDFYGDSQIQEDDSMPDQDDSSGEE